MSRYTYSFNYKKSLADLKPSLTEILSSSDFDIIYDTDDYLMGREKPKPGEVAFSELVTIEVLIDKTKSSPDGTVVNFVIKNESLPLRSQNHCQEISDALKVTIEAIDHWHYLDTESPQLM
jgi:hypothetical protein